MSRHRSASRDDDVGFTRLRAVLAGALVLGVGATLTMAAWTDTEYASGSFAASTFSTESMTATTSWGSHDTAPGAALLAFNASAMSPGASAFAWVNVRTTSPTTVSGTITLDSVAPSGALVPALEYRAVRTAATTTNCDSTAFTGGTFIAGGASTYIAAGSVPASPVSSPLAAAGGEVRFCFEVRVIASAANTFQGTTATLVWKLGATSSS
ncbi:SipW-dependent-type signal peptide-containing protein [Luethyella okanaganae]|uniref:SipW-dependent-type signal peptide-containing protein n=1 Tax=Luethyella okanaganae TaxID=69372 RepID=A0ABW1V9C5_9MICO